MILSENARKFYINIIFHILDFEESYRYPPLFAHSEFLFMKINYRYFYSVLFFSAFSEYIKFCRCV